MAARRLLLRWLFGFSTMLLSSVMAQDDEFEYFRCDACSATFFKVKATLVDRFGTPNTAAAPAFEFIELFESICETMFTKNGFGVKQHEAYETLQDQEKRRTYDQAKWIVENLNGNIPEGMDAPIKVRYIQMGTATTAAWGASPYGENGKGNSFAASGYQSSNKLFIGDLVADVTEEEMSAVFGAYGNITGSKLLAPNSNGKRAAIIQYATAVEAKWIVEHLDGKIPQGMNGTVKVGYEMDKEPVAIAPAFAARSRSNLSNTGGKGGKGAKNGKAVSKCKASVLVKGLYESGALPGGSGVGCEENAVIISCLPGDTTDLHLYQMFSVFGSIPPKGVRAMLNEDGTCTGIGFVNFLDGASADNATSTLNGTRMPDGSVLLVSLMLEGSTGKTFKGGKGGK